MVFAGEKSTGTGLLKYCGAYPVYNQKEQNNPNSKCPTCNGKEWVYEYYSNIEEPPKIDCPSCSNSK
jgi:DNA-directed RNA polymerase subunit RPC12/RpoP